MSAYSDQYWHDDVGGWGPRLTPDVDQRVQNAIKRVYASYPKECMPQGVADAMYIMNVIAHELGIGDGCGNFTLPDDAHA